MFIYIFSEGKLTHQVAFVKYLVSTGKTDPVTGAEVFTWEKAINLYACIDLENIIKVVHIIPGFKRNTAEKDSVFYLNEFTWKM